MGGGSEAAEGRGWPSQCRYQRADLFLMSREEAPSSSLLAVLTVQGESISLAFT